MNDPRFDDLSRRIGKGATRRSAILRVAAAGLAAALAPDLAEAARHKKKCKQGTTKCGKKCCPSGQSCCNKKCLVGCCGGTCQPGQTFADLPPCSPGNPPTCRCLNGVQAGNRLCAADIACDQLSDCTSNDDCDQAISRCAQGCCDTPKCFRFCGA